MIIGSGMLATSFSSSYAGSTDVTICAAGVSNSSCADPREFERERTRLAESLETHRGCGTFVYFSTCSILDPEMANKPYVLHKIAMEQLVKAHAGYLILRLPQLAGRSANPHTLLNYLYARISRSERFSIWCRATRNIIDVDDVLKIGRYLIDNGKLKCKTLNVANIQSYPVTDIVSTMECVCGKKAIFDAVEKGDSYPIDVLRIAPLLPAAGVEFSSGYLSNVLRKYYG
jgi:nucleoside-diphosphate-sugar epimerase